MREKKVKEEKRGVKPKRLRSPGWYFPVIAVFGLILLDGARPGSLPLLCKTSFCSREGKRHRYECENGFQSYFISV